MGLTTEHEHIPLHGDAFRHAVDLPANSLPEPLEHMRHAAYERGDLHATEDEGSDEGSAAP